MAACQATNHPTITLARDLLSQVSSDDLAKYLPVVAAARLNLNDEFEFRRWLELLLQVRPTLMAVYVTNGLSSPDLDVREAARDYYAGRYGPIQGLAQ
jgi:hypothetical protein